MTYFEDSKIDFIKLHGSGTAQNNEAEQSAIDELFGKNLIKTIEYKSQIGHSQGCSTGVELCMLIDRFHEETVYNRKILINASGLGNFYGSCLLVL